MSLRRIALSAALAVLAGCDKPTGAPPGPGAGPGSPTPTPEVAVLAARAQSVPITRDLVGRLAATRTAEVRARVAGIVLERVYTEGTDVERGQVLFRIDPARLEARLRAEEAALAKAEADAANAALTAKRYVDLRERKTSSQQDLDTAQAAERTTAAAVKQARANVETARLDLGYATVTAPIAGRAGRALVTEGALVGEGEATPLTTVDRIDPIFVNFGQSMQEVRALRQAAAPAIKVEILQPDGTPYGPPGTLDFSDLAVDPGTGVLSLRATLPNPDKALLPGQFVNLRLTAGQLDHAFLLPQAALGRDAQGAYLMVLGAEGKVEQRRVESHGMTRKEWILTGNLKDDDQVIVAGLQKVKPGAPAKAAAPTGTVPGSGPGSPPNLSTPSVAPATPPKVKG
ncbi:MAG TPA: efflux RND transporter periplasmic adaptor subunit [Lamprocystis sp. (in: g-proteobacteria)]|nr:efflux RND transporter periplasmic adaptor subunit [Lamprocystis sp. (in: g-proteobacteria)]